MITWFMVGYMSLNPCCFHKHVSKKKNFTVNQLEKCKSRMDSYEVKHNRYFEREKEWEKGGGNISRFPAVLFQTFSHTLHSRSSVAA